MTWVPVDAYNGNYSMRGLVSYDVRSDRPGYGGGWYLCDELHDWLVDRKIYYQLAWETVKKGYWDVGFEDANQAMLFKLTWM